MTVEELRAAMQADQKQAMYQALLSAGLRTVGQAPTPYRQSPMQGIAQGMLGGLGDYSTLMQQAGGRAGKQAQIEQMIKEQATKDAENKRQEALRRALSNTMYGPPPALESSAGPMPPMDERLNKAFETTMSMGSLEDAARINTIQASRQKVPDKITGNLGVDAQGRPIHLRESGAEGPQAFIKTGTEKETKPTIASHQYGEINKALAESFFPSYKQNNPDTEMSSIFAPTDEAGGGVNLARLRGGLTLGDRQRYDNVAQKAEKFVAGGLLPREAVARAWKETIPKQTPLPPKKQPIGAASNKKTFIVDGVPMEAVMAEEGEMINKKQAWILKDGRKVTEE